MFCTSIRKHIMSGSSCFCDVWWLLPGSINLLGIAKVSPSFFSTILLECFCKEKLLFINCLIILQCSSYGKRWDKCLFYYWPLFKIVAWFLPSSHNDFSIVINLPVYKYTMCPSLLWLMSLLRLSCPTWGSWE